MSENQILLSFASATNIAGFGTVGPSDVILFQADSLGDDTSGTFSVFATAAALGLDGKGPAGSLDALDVLDDGSLVFSIAGDVSLSFGGTNTFIRRADVVQYTPVRRAITPQAACNCSSTAAMRT